MSETTEVKQKNFVTFLSPGTFMSERTTLEVESWDVAEASEMAHTIVERHNATPYAFYFTTIQFDPAGWDYTTSARSITYFLGGTIWTVEDVVKRNDPEERILLSNMRGNGYRRVICNCNSWKTVMPMKDDDVVLQWRKPNE